MDSVAESTLKPCLAEVGLKYTSHGPVVDRCPSPQERESRLRQVLNEHAKRVFKSLAQNPEAFGPPGLDIEGHHVLGDTVRDPETISHGVPLAHYPRQEMQPPGVARGGNDVSSESRGVVTA